MINAVQSFWITGGSAENGNWVNKRFESIGWSLSYFLLKKNFGGVQLYCNTEGRNFLVDTLGLDYDRIHTNLDEIDDLTRKCWGLAKMHTYAAQEAPFVHVDGDVFFFDLPEKDFLNSDLFAQSLEMDEPLYRHILATLKKHIVDYPEYLNHNKAAMAINAGILGGQNGDLFKVHYSESVKFLKNNIELIDSKPDDFCFFSIFIEQCLLLCLSNYKNVKFKFLKKPVFRTNFSDVLNFNRISPITKTPGYAHLLGSNRFRVHYCNLVEFWLHRFWPEQLEKINALYPAIENSEKELSIYLSPEHEKLLPHAHWIIDKPGVVLRYPYMRTTTLFGIEPNECLEEDLLNNAESEKLTDCIAFEKRRIVVLNNMLAETNGEWIYKHLESHLEFCTKTYEEIADLKFQLNKSKILTSTHNWYNDLNYPTQKYWYNLIIDSQKICFQEFVLSETECRLMELMNESMSIEDLWLAWNRSYATDNNPKIKTLIHETLKELIAHQLVQIS